jgi:hypothetical protein
LLTGSSRDERLTVSCGRARFVSGMLVNGRVNSQAREAVSAVMGLLLDPRVGTRSGASGVGGPDATV